MTSWGKNHHLWMEIGDSTNLKHDGDFMGDSWNIDGHFNCIYKWWICRGLPMKNDDSMGCS